MHKLTRILVAVKDPRARSLPAVAKAARLAQAYGAELELFHSLSAPVFVDALGGAGDLAQFERAQRADLKAALEAIAVRVRRHGLAVDVRVDWDYPVHEAIIRRARRTRADLIVAERHAAPRHAKWLLSYTDWELLRASPLPVLIVKSPKVYRHAPILAAVDPLHAHSKPARLDVEILDTASALAKALRSRLHVVHAWRMPPLAAFSAFGEGYPLALPTDASEVEAEARDALRGLLGERRLAPGAVHLVAGDPGTAIPRAARESGCGIVVMGAVSRSALGRAFLGNTAEHVLDALAADALVVKPPRFALKMPRSRRGAQVITAAPLS